jgi:hypothetical protein
MGSNDSRGAALHLNCCFVASIPHADPFTVLLEQGNRSVVPDLLALIADLAELVRGPVVVAIELAVPVRAVA